MVSSGLGMTFAAESGVRFLDAGGLVGGPAALSGAAVWRPLSNLGIELRDIAIWRADAKRSPLLRPLIDVVREVRTQYRPSRAPRPAP
jgi:hypothetical protein